MLVSNHRIHGLTLVFSLVLVTTGCATSGTLLDGREKSMVVVGYSTSYAWPDMLQEMLDDHTGGRRTYHVLNAVVGGSPVESWLEGAQTYDRTFGKMTRDYLGPNARRRGDTPEPKIALCQQSLQRTRNDRGPIADPNDAEGVRIGADDLEKLARQLKEVGIEKVYYGMHIYKEPIEPEVGNERIALAALLDRGHPYIFEGPDVWEPTREHFPQAFSDDRLHPNELGMKIMAEGWYRTVAGSKVRQGVIDRMHARSYDVDAMNRAYIELNRNN